MHADIAVESCLVMPFPALAGPRREVIAALGLSEGAFEACRDREAVTCRIVLFALLVRHCGQEMHLARDFLSIPAEQAVKIDEMFRTYFLIYAVPRDIRNGALALSMRKFLAGKEDRLDFPAFLRGRPRLRIAPVAPEALELAPPSMTEIVGTVAEYLDVMVIDMKSERRQRADIMQARHVAIYACRLLTPASLIAIGKFFGGRDHSTVIYACKAVEGKIGGRPAEGLGLVDLLDHVASRVPAVADLHRAASLRQEKRDKAFFSQDLHDNAYREAA